MANQQNLKSWKPGQSGNPNGKPKGTKHLSTWIQDLLNDPDFIYKLSNGRKQTGPPMEAILQALIQKAINGDIRAFEALAKFGYGAKVDITTKNQVLPTPLLAGLTLDVSK